MGGVVALIQFQTVSQRLRSLPGKAPSAALRGAAFGSFAPTRVQATSLAVFGSGASAFPDLAMRWPRRTRPSERPAGRENSFPPLGLTLNSRRPMNRRVKFILYAGLVVVAAVFFYFFLHENHLVNQDVPGASKSRMMAYAAAFFGSLVAFALLVAYEFSHFVGEKTEEFFFNDGGEPVHDPEYEEAEQMWANGQHIDAIGHLREYMKRDPRQLHAAIRIAEIYENDLRNPLAAALEYEDILQKKLPAERWGWAAVHLANLYSGPLNRTDQAMSLLERIAQEYPRTGAARKAREHLGLPEPEPEPEPVAPPKPRPTVSLEAAATESAPEEPPAAEPPRSNLPPGFRPK